jgi:hypothetical protein
LQGCVDAFPLKVGLGNSLTNDFLELADAISLYLPALGLASLAVQAMYIREFSKTCGTGAGLTGAAN